MTIFLFSTPISCEGEKEEKLSRNNYAVYLTNDTLSEMTMRDITENPRGGAKQPLVKPWAKYGV